MAKVIVYDEYTNRLFTYNLSENDPMPYAYGNTMRVREFRGSSNSPTLWTTTRAMEAWNLTRRRYGKGIYIGYAFKRIWEGGHGTASQHYAGVSFDVGQNVSYSQRVAIRNAAVATGAWGYVEPISMTPTWVHFDRRYGTPASSGTENAVRAFQRAVSLTADGICGCNTWKKLTAASVGIGRTRTVID